jgi:hypothetical protein
MLVADAAMVENAQAKKQMPKRYSKPTLVMNIEREWFAAIHARPTRKTVEYRDLSDYWLRRLEKVGRPPFRLRLLNGMRPPVPATTIQGQLELHLGRVFEVKHWDRLREKPTRRSRSDPSTPL